MKILAIETSCDDTSVAVLEARAKNIKVLANIISSQTKIHAPYGGVFPSLAAREHEKNLPKVLKLALRQAGLRDAGKTDLLCVTRGPGLEIALWRGINFAQSLAQTYKKPLIGTNHLVGHIFSNWLKPLGQNSSLSFLFDKKNYPILNLVVSGGHTQLVLLTKPYQFKLLGETLDDAAGEAFDKTARLLGLGYPGGPIVSLRATQTQNSKKDTNHNIKFPRPMINSKNLDFSFSGLKTSVLYKIRDLKNSGIKITKNIVNEICYEFQEATTDVLVHKTLKAAQQYGVKTVTLSGGVSANKRLRQQLEEKVSKKLDSVNLLKPLMTYTADNAAMIGLATYLGYLNNKKIASGKETISAKGNLGYSDK